MNALMHTCVKSRHDIALSNLRLNWSFLSVGHVAGLYNLSSSSYNRTWLTSKKIIFYNSLNSQDHTNMYLHLIFSCCLAKKKEYNLNIYLMKAMIYVLITIFTISFIYIP